MADFRTDPEVHPSYRQGLSAFPDWKDTMSTLPVQKAGQIPDANPIPHAYRSGFWRRRHVQLWAGARLQAVLGSGHRAFVT